MKSLQKIALLASSIFIFNSCDLNLTGDVEVDSSPKGNIVGKIELCYLNDDGNPTLSGVSTATIGLFKEHNEPTGISAEASIGGNYSMINVKEGTYNYIVKFNPNATYTTYYNKYGGVTVIGGQTTTLNILFNKDCP